MDILALNAAAVERREAGYKDWIEQGKIMSEYVQTSKLLRTFDSKELFILYFQAVAKSDDPDATR